MHHRPDYPGHSQQWSDRTDIDAADYDSGNDKRILQVKKYPFKICCNMDIPVSCLYVPRVFCYFLGLLYHRMDSGWHMLVGSDKEYV